MSTKQHTPKNYFIKVKHLMIAAAIGVFLVFLDYTFSLLMKFNVLFDGKWHSFLRTLSFFVLPFTVLFLATLFLSWKSLKLKKHVKSLEYLAHYDVLTTLPNRRHFEEELKRNVSFAKRYNQEFALLFFDLDNFKYVNDTLGHHYGDLLLQKMSFRVTSILRQYDFVARVGGDEFAILIPNVQHKTDVAHIAEKLLNVIAKPYKIKNKTLTVTASIGIVLYAYDGNDAKTLLKNADIAMYKAKQSGRNKYKYFSSTIDLQYKQQVEVEKALRTAIKKDEFYLCFQPIFNAVTHQLESIETMFRWKHPVFGDLGSSKYIAIAEQIGIIAEIDNWVFKTAFNQYSEWGLNKKNISYAFNLSEYQLSDDSKTIHYIMQANKRSKIPHEKIELELTETAIMAGIVSKKSIWDQLRGFQIALSINDFGTGYSSFSRLKNLPLNVLRIDKSFIDDIETDEKDATIVKSIIALAKEMNLITVAEGIERKEQLDILVQFGCDRIQGNYFSKPLDTEQMTRFLVENNLNH